MTRESVLAQVSGREEEDGRERRDHATTADQETKVEVSE